MDVNAYPCCLNKRVAFIASKPQAGARTYRYIAAKDQ